MSIGARLIEAECPGCGAIFEAYDNTEVCCPDCDLEFVVDTGVDLENE